jgi:hypothetical protein
MAFALGELNVRAPSPPLSAAYDALVQYIIDSAVPGPQGGLSLNTYPGLRWGTAGIGLFLLQVRDRTGRPPHASPTVLKWTNLRGLLRTSSSRRADQPSRSLTHRLLARPPLARPRPPTHEL